MKIRQSWRFLIGFGWAAVCAGCGGPSVEDAVTVASLAARLADPMTLARLDQPDTRLHSSYDRTGGNEDYGNFLRDSETPGWKVLVDLKGPGYVSRMWFTGAREGVPHRFRFYFDGEASPRLEGAIQELFGGHMEPFLAPLAEYNNYCWYSFVPMPYAQGLRIECEAGAPDADGGQPKLYFQVSESRLPRRTLVDTFAWPLPERDLRGLEQVRQVWARKRLPPAGERVETVLADWTAGFRLEGPAVVHRLEFEPEWSQIPEELRNDILRDWMVSIRYDGAAEDSVRVPLGDFCGMPWFRIRTQSLFFGMERDTLFSAFPMPFHHSMTVRLEAGRIPSVPVTLRAWVEKTDEDALKPLGYFHSGWWRSMPNDVGRPHPILRVKGNGKFVGCLVSVCALDGSYWVLEGDESIRKDAEKTPGWLGTGLEDYFNGGWYYQNVMAGPSHGLFVKEPFRTVQYRVHWMDPSRFRQSLDMEFERGPEQLNRAYFESVSWYYLSVPQKADTVGLRADYRTRPRDNRLEPMSLMTALWNFERLADDRGEHDELLLRFRREASQWTPVDRRMLEFRLALLEEKLGGPDPVARFLEDENEAVRFAAEALRRERAGETATAVLYANMPARLFVDGREVLQAGHPEQPVAESIALPPGRHTLVLAAGRQAYPDWIQLALRKQEWMAVTDSTWTFAFNPQGSWERPDYDDSAWPEVGGTGVKGPPEEPYIWVQPDPFLGMLSKASGLRPSRDWPRTGGFVVYRKTIDVP
ncbi:MAG: DUF2961 domain-containing protein [Verrucomicrobiota bacterium]|jgi:hypothetical protein|nr:DUF2961 domain-containing protein [Verrucomicrobiota bacterium]